MGAICPYCTRVLDEGWSFVRHLLMDHRLDWREAIYFGERLSRFRCRCGETFLAVSLDSTYPCPYCGGRGDRMAYGKP